MVKLARRQKILLSSIYPSSPSICFLSLEDSLEASWKFLQICAYIHYYKSFCDTKISDFFLQQQTSLRNSLKQVTRYHPFKQKYWEALPWLKSFILLSTDVPISRSVCKQANTFINLMNTAHFWHQKIRHFCYDGRSTVFGKKPVILTIMEAAYIWYWNKRSF